MKLSHRLRRALRLRRIPGPSNPCPGLAARVSPWRALPGGGRGTPPRHLAWAASLACASGAFAAEPVKESPGASSVRLETAGPFNSKLRLEVYDRVRGEMTDWFGDPVAQGKVVPKESSYAFMANKFQLGLRFSSEPVEAFVQFQDTVLAGLPDNGVGLGAVYYANTHHTTANGATLRQGWAKLKMNDFFLSGGRQLYSDAAQGAARNKTLKWIQDYRWAQRLIGPWDYTHTGRSFDGGSLGYISDDFEVSGFAFLPTAGGFDIDGMSEISQITVAGATANLRDSGLFGNTLGRLSYYYYSDDRNLVAADNRPEAVRTSTKAEPIEVHTLALSAAHTLPLGPGVVDGMFYGFGQVGDWQGLNHGAWAYGVELGYQLPEVWGSPWLRAGINSGSGDNNPGDGDHGTFFQMLPTVFLYAQFPFYNMMNNQDVFLQALLKPHPMVNLRMDFHWLKLNESRDLLYAGSGATNDTFFGYAGTPTGGFDELAYLAHLSVNLKPTDYLSFNVHYAHAFGQEVIAAQYSDRQGDYAFVEACLSF